MRIWSLHPKYLDTKGLVALWRETLLAKHVLEGKTKGYKNHPQLLRFKLATSPLDAVNHYLSIVYWEAENRGYTFSREKIQWDFQTSSIHVTSGQVEYERQHLSNKLKIRDLKKYEEMSRAESIDIHPLFTILPGGIEDWEKIS